MRKLSFFFALLFCQVQLFSQSELAVSKSVSTNFEKEYNTENFEAIFALFSTEMQKALDLDKTKEFLSGLKTQAGNITKMEFVRYEQSYATYKTTFERALFAVNISVDSDSKINGLFVKPFKERNLPTLTRNTTKLRLPFDGEWTVVWGGDTKEQNYHVINDAQKHAFDVVITDQKGKSYKTDGKTNEDYYAFGKPLCAPCDAEVVLVVDGIKDNLPGIMNPIYVPGNTVILKTASNEFLILAHFKQHTIIVKQGQKVKQGQMLGQCGNSGNSSEAHLHFHIQNIEDMNTATGAKCYFEKNRVNGQLKTDYSPIRMDKISNP